MREEETTIRRSKSKMLLLLGGSAGFVCLGLFIARMGYLERGPGDFGVFIGLVCILFFGLCTVLIAVKLFDNRPAVQFLSQGLLVPDISAQPIGWRDIVAVRLFTLKNQKIIELGLSQQAEQNLPFTRTVRYTRGANRRLGIHGVCLGTTGLRRRPEDIVAMIGQWAERAQADGSTA